MGAHSASKTEGISGATRELVTMGLHGQAKTAGEQLGRGSALADQSEQLSQMGCEGDACTMRAEAKQQQRSGLVKAGLALVGGLALSGDLVRILRKGIRNGNSASSMAEGGEPPAAGALGPEPVQTPPRLQPTPVESSGAKPSAGELSGPPTPLIPMPKHPGPNATAAELQAFKRVVSEVAKRRRDLRAENLAAKVLARDGGLKVRQNPASGLESPVQCPTDVAGFRPGARMQPDFLIEGKYYDCVLPGSGTSWPNIFQRIDKKLGRGQAERFVVPVNRRRPLDGFLDELQMQVKWRAEAGLPMPKEVLVLHGSKIYRLYP